VTTATSEDGNNLAYGGTNVAHNGGSLKYVREMEKINDTSEMNGFSFHSVGSGNNIRELSSLQRS
jgi:hypothetical protein